MSPDSITHQFRKFQADGALRTTGSTTTSSATASTNNLNLPPPPAYTPSSAMHFPINNHMPGHDEVFTDDDTDEYDDEEDDRSPYPITSITVSAPIKVVGHGNILNTSSLTSMLSSSLTTALQQHQSQLSQDDNTSNNSITESDNNNHNKADSGSKRSNHQSRPSLRPLHLNVNCAVSIIGSRNVVGESVAKAAVIARMTGLSSLPSSSAATATAGTTVPASLPSTATTATNATITTDNNTNAIMTTRKRPAESESTVEDESPPSKKVNNTGNGNHN